MKRFKMNMANLDKTKELNLVPFLNLFTVLVPVLLTSVVFVQIEFLHLFLPVEPSGDRVSSEEQFQRRPLNLAIRISEKEFAVVATGDIPTFEPIARLHGERLVPDSLVENQITNLPDYSSLITCLAEIKRQYQEEDEVVIVAKDDIDYPTLIAVMDCARYQDRFPVISFSRWEL